MNSRVVIKQNEVLSDNWYVLRKFTFDYQNQNGTWETQSREAYDRCLYFHKLTISRCY
jgi:GDP-mannose pyrophosphatase NudK